MNGEVLYDSSNTENKLKLDNHLSRPEIKLSIKNGSGFDVRKSKTFKEKFAYFSTFLTTNQQEKIFIRLSKSYKSEDSQIFYFTLIQIFIFIILNIFIKFFYSNFLKRDFENKINVMKQFLRSNESDRNLHFNDETWISQFWIVLREWQMKNLNNLERLEKEKKILASLLKSLPFFIALFDSKGKVIIKNNAFQTLIPESSKDYMELFPSINIIDIFRNSMINKKDKHEIVYLKKNSLYWDIKIKYLDFDDLFLVVIQDITENKENEKNKKDFLDDISHEIKTPLTNIKGYLIAMEEANQKDKEVFLTVVNKNIKKIESILQDFLKISKLENQVISDYKVFNIEEIKTELYSSLHYIILKKNVELNISGISELYLPKFEILSILKNIIENSIIYNESKPPIISLKIESNKNEYIFKIKDNGVGIASEDINKIFNRFYRVEKSRNRNHGGTGLGLAIVKKLLEKLNGNILVKSNVGEGSEFTLNIPKVSANSATQ